MKNKINADDSKPKKNIDLAETDRDGEGTLVPIRLDELMSLWDALHVREEVSNSVLARYAEALRNGSRLPPPVVFDDGTQKWVADGHHTICTYFILDYVTNKEVECEVRRGSKRDALIYALGANAKHGLPMSRADKRRAVELALRDEELRGWSDREIARYIGCSNSTVSNARGRLYPDPDGEAKRIAKNGRVIRTANIGKTRGKSTVREAQSDDDSGASRGTDSAMEPITRESVEEVKAVGEMWLKFNSLWPNKWDAVVYLEWAARLAQGQLPTTQEQLVLRLLRCTRVATDLTCASDKEVQNLKASIRQVWREKELATGDIVSLEKRLARVGERINSGEPGSGRTTSKTNSTFKSPKRLFRLPKTKSGDPLDGMTLNVDAIVTIIRPSCTPNYGEQRSRKTIASYKDGKLSPIQVSLVRRLAVCTQRAAKISQEHGGSKWPPMKEIAGLWESAGLTEKQLVRIENLLKRYSKAA